MSRRSEDGAPGWLSPLVVAVEVILLAALLWWLA